jgi:hypothetical protein
MMIFRRGSSRRAVVAKPGKARLRGDMLVRDAAGGRRSALHRLAVDYLDDH